MKLLDVSILVFLLVSCNTKPTDTTMYKTGTFKTYLEDTDIMSIATRNDSIQIESYNNRKDTFAIVWKSNFEYVLTKLHPKNELDSTLFHVKITGFKEKSYTFKAYYKGSNFKQKGRAVKMQ